MTEENQQVFDALKAALWGGHVSLPLSQGVLRELHAQCADGLTLRFRPEGRNAKYAAVATFVQMASVQAEAVQILQEAGIPAVVLKGTAAGLYYPLPYLRRYGDIDILVHPSQYEQAIQALKTHGCVQEGSVGSAETHLWRSGFLIELHQRPPGLERVQEGNYILRYLLDGLHNIQTGEIAQPQCSFPMLPWKQNGLELIWHIREHLYNGLGLRQIIDWMMFVHHHLRETEAIAEFRPVLENSGLLNLAQVVTRMCQIYLGLEGDFSWCAEAEDSLCEELMAFILEQGNFGHKRTDDKTAKVLTRYHNPIAFLKGMQKRGVESWPAAQKHPFLRPFAWLHTGVLGARKYLTKEGRKRLAAGLDESRQRRDLFDRLYGGDAPKGVSLPTAAPNAAPRAVRKKSLKERIRPLYQRIAHSPLRAPLYHLENLYFTLRYPLFGKPKIAAADRENVEQNVTFIYKSFNRQKKAAKLYRCIKAYYPRARVVIADDSREPLEIAGMAEGDLILHLPFDSGLSKGLIAALAEVKTPYTMRLDDDELLTPSSRIHEQLTYLQKHDEVDLVGLQAKHRHPERGAEAYSRVRMNQRLSIPAGTIIEGREVVYKTANIFLARTDRLRSVGYDPNIHLIDHHEFFYRAAGQIVCVQDPLSYVLHCHNHFEKTDKSNYRNRLNSDSAYITKKHGSAYR